MWPSYSVIYDPIYIYIEKEHIPTGRGTVYTTKYVYIYILLNILPSSIWITVTVTATGRFLSHG